MGMVMSILYVWCQLNKDTIVNFWFGTQFKAMYLPWVLFGFNMIIAGGGVMELVGILIGHMYFFLMFKYPQDFGGPSLLSTPGILYQFPQPERRQYWLWTSTCECSAWWWRWTRRRRRRSR